MQLRELLADPGLGLRLLHGDDQALRRAVRWVFTTDLIDPSRYLSGGELVVTGLVWRHGPADSERFVSTLASAGVAALAAGEAVFEGIPDDLVTSCRHHGLVLVAVPEDTSFAALGERVIGSVTAARNDRLASSLGRQRDLLSAVAQGVGLDEVAARVSRAAGTACRVLTATGRPVVAGPVPLPEPDVDRVTRAFLSAERFPAVTSGAAGSTRYSILPVGPATEQRLAAWFVVAEHPAPQRDEDGDRDPVPEAVADLVTIAALDRARRSEGARAARVIADEAVALLVEGAGARPETAVRLRQLGLDTAAPIVVTVAQFAGRPDLAETAREVLDDVAAHVGPAAVGAAPDATVVALLADAAPPAPITFRRVLSRLEPGLRRVRLTIGVSEPSPVSALSGALEEAQHARRLAESRTERVAVVSGAEVTSHVSLLAAVPDDLRRSFAARVLGPVRDYDERHQSELLATLEVFLACSGSWSRTAAALHLHVNTVRYRIARIEELTGRDLGTFADRVDFLLALGCR